MNLYECLSCGAFIEEKGQGMAMSCSYCGSHQLNRAAEEEKDLNLNCPFCGGGFSLPNSYNMSKCPYCSRSIFIKMTKDIQQFFLEPRKKPGEVIKIAASQGFKGMKKILYVPFWALRGTLISWILGYSMEEGPKMAVSRMAASGQYNPSGINAVQSPYMKEQKIYKDFSSKILFLSMGDYVARQLKYYTLGTRMLVETLSIKDYDKLSADSDILKPLFSVEEAVDKLMDRAFKAPVVHKERVVIQSTRLDMLGKRFLMIYVPFYRFSNKGRSLLVDSFSGDTQRIADSVLFDPAPKKIEDSLYDYSVSNTATSTLNIGALELVPFSCPVCGDDLPEKRLDCFLQCNSCRESLVVENGILKSVKANYVQIPASFSNDPSKCRTKYYPYWRYKVSFYAGGKKVCRVDGLKSIFPGFMDKFQRNEEFKQTFMYVPAFGRIKTPGLDKISVIYTKMQIVFRYSKDCENNYERAAVIYDKQTAKSFGYTILLKISNLNRSSNISKVRNNFLRLSDAELFYFPFLISHTGMHLDPILGLNYTKNSFIAERSY